MQKGKFRRRLKRRPVGALPVHGVLLFDKPSGWTSSFAVQEVKKLFQAEKVGHTGTLDPLASGLLPLCFGEATKLSAFFLDADKCYEVTSRLGATTASGDSELPENATFPVPDWDAQQWQAHLQPFLGRQMQIPPMYSALKRDGVPLYALAREGQEVVREAREVHIYALDYLGHSANELSLRVHCSKGTYIRTLVEDIAKAAASGAYVTQLRRLCVASLGKTVLPLYDWPTLTALSPAARLATLLPLDAALPDYPALTVSEQSFYYLCQGSPITLAPLPAHQGFFRLYYQEKFFALAEVDAFGQVAPRRLFFVQEK
jgi:tRNA pseudouridine55 synthase